MSDPRVSIGLAVLALALAIVTVVDVAGDRDASPASTRVVPELSSSPPSRIEISRAGEAIVLEADGEVWRVREPIDVPADPAAVRALLGAAEMLSHRRREPGRGADPALGLAEPRARLELGWPGGELVSLAIGDDAGGAGTWIARGEAGDAFLVPAYAAAGLRPELDRVRGKRLVPAAEAEALEVAVGDARGRLSLSPPSVAIAGGVARADPAKVASLWRSLRNLDIERFVDRAAKTAVAIEVRVEGQGVATELAVDGACDDDALHVVATVGAGCVDAAPLEALAAIATAPETLVDRQVVAGGAIEMVALGADAKRIERAITDAERDGADRWRAALEAAVSGELAPAPSTPPIATVTVTTAGAPPQTLRLYRGAGGLLLRRDDEPVALVATDAARNLLEPAAASRFRDLRLLAADPSTVREIRWQRGGESLARWQRGELLEDWRDAGGQRIDAAVYEPLLSALAPLQAERGAPRLAPGEPTILSVAIAPAMSDAAPSWHRFEITACTARELGADAAFVLDDETCAALAPPEKD